MIDVICVDARPIVLAGLRQILSGHAGIRPAGFYQTGREALQALVNELQPLVVLTDIMLPDTNGSRFCLDIKKKRPSAQVVAFSQRNERSCILSMLQCGAGGYLVETAGAEEILAAVCTVGDGQVYLCSRAQQEMNSTPDLGGYALPSITRREKEILQLIGRGLTSRRIADALSVSTHTVEAHRKNLMEKFYVKNMPAVIKLAAEYQLL
ncbi:response regulator transcription factor [Chitinophaga lutea]|nr:response regulator transcription factor [Chitinophaga lutea]